VSPLTLILAWLAGISFGWQLRPLGAAARTVLARRRMQRTAEAFAAWAERQPVSS
jgi:hypothetical protein